MASDKKGKRVTASAIKEESRKGRGRFIVLRLRQYVAAKLQNTQSQYEAR